MVNLIPPEVIDVYKQIQKAGFEIYLVGGCVRDMLLKKRVKDWDLTTGATPEEILKFFPNGFYDNAFGTVGIPIAIDKEKIILEVTTFRKEVGFSDKRHPDKVIWGKSISDDLSRRDFTINAIALKLTFNDKGKTAEIVDPFGGQKDLEIKVVKSVGDPKMRFKEDALRLLRAIRIAAEYEFTIEDKTWKEIQNDAPLIKIVSGERIRKELLRILSTDHAYEGIMLLKDSNLMEYIIPELLEGIGVSQLRPGRHHTSDVFTHNLLSLKYCTSKDPVVRLASLLHDIGKPKVAAKDKAGFIVFYNHEIVGARMAEEICERLKFSNKEKNRVYTLIRWHMFTVDEKITDAAVRRFIRRVGTETVRDIMDVRVGDRLGGGTQTAESWRLKLFKKRIEDQLKPAPFSINNLVIDGNDIIEELNIKPGPIVGKILQKIFEEVDEDLSKNNKEYLLKRIEELNKNA